MDKKTILTILAILIIPILAFFGLTFKQDTSNVAQASGKPTIIKFTSTMCLECQEINKTFKQIFPKYQDSVNYTEVIVDSRKDMNNNLIKKYNVTLVPTVIMLNSDGTQSKRIESAIPAAELERDIKGLK